MALPDESGTISLMHHFQEKLLAWFVEHARDLPWRRTYDPYHIWISEIMLQQTRMERAVAYFNRWLKRFPDITAVAEAAGDEILKHWEGLGYYSRARNLHRTARLLRRHHGSRIPPDYRTLLALPGIGEYTAGAIMSLAFNAELPIIDANVKRVVARIYDIGRPMTDRRSREFIRRTAAGLIPPGRARQFNQALMELGALICRPRRPHCIRCPVENTCRAHRLGVEAERPVTGGSRGSIPIDMATGLLVYRGRILIQKRPPAGVWPNLWEFPGGRLEPGETPEQALLREFLEETELAVDIRDKITTTRHSYTIYRVTLHCFACRPVSDGAQPVLHAAQACRWATPAELSGYPFPAGHRKLLEYIERNGGIARWLNDP